MSCIDVLQQPHFILNVFRVREAMVAVLEEELGTQVMLLKVLLKAFRMKQNLSERDVVNALRDNFKKQSTTIEILFGRWSAWQAGGFMGLDALPTGDKTLEEVKRGHFPWRTLDDASTADLGWVLYALSSI